MIFSEDARTTIGIVSDLPSYDDWLMPPSFVLSRLYYGLGVSNSQALMDRPLHGRSFAQWIDDMCGYCGGIRWHVAPESGDQRSNLVLWDPYDTPASPKSLSWGGGGLASRPDVAEGALRRDFRDLASAVSAIGGKRRIQITLSSSSGGGLIPGWTTDQQTAWLADPEDDIRHPNVFLRWLIDPEIEWSDFTDDANYCWGPRKLSGKLLKRYVEAALDGGSPNSVQVLCWRLVDSTWEPLPAHIGVMLLPGAKGIQFSGNARSGVDPWTWDGDSAPYPIRITLVIESDDALLETYSNSYFATMPLYRQIVSPNKRIECCRKAIVYQAPESETETELGASAPDILRDDTDALGVEAFNELLRLGSPRSCGRLVLPGLRADVALGDYIEKLSGATTDWNIYVGAWVVGIAYEGLIGRPGDDRKPVTILDLDLY
jgi:hypothetical protein